MPVLRAATTQSGNSDEQSLSGFPDWRRVSPALRSGLSQIIIAASKQVIDGTGDDEGIWRQDGLRRAGGHPHARLQMAAPAGRHGKRVYVAVPRSLQGRA